MSPMPPPMSAPMPVQRVALVTLYVRDPGTGGEHQARDRGGVPPSSTHEPSGSLPTRNILMETEFFIKFDLTHQSFATTVSYSP